MNIWIKNKFRLLFNRLSCYSHSWLSSMKTPRSLVEVVLLTMTRPTVILESTRLVLSFLLSTRNSVLLWLATSTLPLDHHITRPSFAMFFCRYFVLNILWFSSKPFHVSVKGCPALLSLSFLLYWKGERAGSNHLSQSAKNVKTIAPKYSKSKCSRAKN